MTGAKINTEGEAARANIVISILLRNSYSGAPPVLFNFITPNAGKERDPSFMLKMLSPVLAIMRVFQL